jgi:hypothetical protein
MGSHVGQRANLLIVEDGQYQLFYSHWCANTLPRDLFWGPQYAVKFIRMQREVDESGWLDEVWAEGAAIVDVDKQTLLLFGGENILYDVPLRRVYLELLSRTWKTWHIRWTYEGVAAIADYVGYPRTKVLSTREEEVACSLAPPKEKGWTDIVASIRWAKDQVRLYPLAGDPEAYLFSGPSLLNLAEVARGLDRLPLDEWTSDFPTGGFHIEVPSQTVEFWTAKDAPDVVARVAKHWSDWTVRWHQDAYEFQAERAKGLLRFPSPSRDSLEKQVVEVLLSEPGRSSVDLVLEIAERHRAEGNAVEINPWALRDDRLDLPLDVRRSIVASAVGGEAVP